MDLTEVPLDFSKKRTNTVNNLISQRKQQKQKMEHDDTSVKLKDVLNHLLCSIPRLQVFSFIPLYHLEMCLFGHIVQSVFQSHLFGFFGIFWISPRIKKKLVALNDKQQTDSE